MNKAALRIAARATRDRLHPPGEDPACADRLAAHLAGLLGSRLPGIIGGYWPIGSEIDPRPALARLRALGAHIALPHTPPPGAGLSFHVWHADAPLLAGRFGTFHPDGPPVLPDLLLVPLLGFDLAGHRLGHGGGYYDRTLAAHPGLEAIGCAYAAQQIAAIPAEPHDQRLAAVATEQGIVPLAAHWRHRLAPRG